MTFWKTTLAVMLGFLGAMGCMWVAYLVFAYAMINMMVGHI